MNMLNKMAAAKDKIQHRADKLYIGALLTLGMLAAPDCVWASGGALDVANAQKTIVNMINSLLNPILVLVGSLGSLYCVLLGVKYAKAEEPQDREKAKQHLKSAIIGFVLIFVLIVALRLLLPSFTSWMNSNSNAITDTN